jgi:hypothetical protein
MVRPKSNESILGAFSQIHRESIVNQSITQLINKIWYQKSFLFFSQSALCSTSSSGCLSTSLPALLNRLQFQHHFPHHFAGSPQPHVAVRPPPAFNCAERHEPVWQQREEAHEVGADENLNSD